MNITILDGGVLNPGDVDWSPLARLGQLRVFADTQGRDLAERCAGQDVLLINKTPIGRQELEAIRDVRMVGVLATGYNNIDVDALAEKNIPVCNVKAYGVEDVAQHAIALLLELCRQTSLHSASVKSGEWNRLDTWCYWKKTPVCLAGKTMGIVGYGAIGQAVARIAHALGMSVLAASRSPKPAPDFQPFAFAAPAEIWAESDVISLHCPLTPETKHIVNAYTIAAMRQGAILLNTARGPLVDEQAAAQALHSGQLGGLGTDVLAVEPPERDNPLLSAPNTLITPHIAWATARARQRIIDLMAENISNWLKGQPCNAVNGV